uniref:Peptidase S1 domain-containing protein n=1 Tax=Sinocyclocheilus rhinocerous TaxID=307959 RepID=A0A673KBV0_9TELE
MTSGGPGVRAGSTGLLRRSSRFLRKVLLPVADQMSCINSTEHVITNNMFCSGYLLEERDACAGDSGRCAAEGKYGMMNEESGRSRSQSALIYIYIYTLKYILKIYLHEYFLPIYFFAIVLKI